MPRYDHDDEEEDYDQDDYDADAADSDDELEGVYDEDDEEPTVPCPFCRREIHEDAQRCPYCEQYLSREVAPPARKPWWIVAGAIICLYIAWRWIVG